MSETNLDIQAEGIDVNAIVQEIQDAVAEKTASGEYNDALITQAERSNLFNMKDDAEFLDYYLSCITRSSQVDIRAFEIPDPKGGPAGKAMKKLKQSIWGVLKFYTYRMWTQQNQINSLIVNGLNIVRNKLGEQQHEQEKRITQLEAALNKAGIEIPPEEDTHE